MSWRDGCFSSASFSGTVYSVVITPSVGGLKTVRLSATGIQNVMYVKEKCVDQLQSRDHELGSH